MVIEERSADVYQYLLEDNKWTFLKNIKIGNQRGNICGIFQINNICYVFDGEAYEKLPDDGKYYTFSKNSKFYRAEACQIENEILLIGQHEIDGYSTKDRKSKTIDVVEGTTQNKRITTKRGGYALVEYQGCIWITGGFLIQNDSGNGNFRKDIEVYDRDSNTSKIFPKSMIEFRYFHSVIVYKSKLFVFGGRSRNRSYLNTVEMYSPFENKFVMKAPMKIARSSFGCCRIRNLVYITGGCTGKKFIPTKSVEIYNLDNDTWSDGADLPVPLGGNYGCVVNKKLS